MKDNPPLKNIQKEISTFREAPWSWTMMIVTDTQH